MGDVALSRIRPGVALYLSRLAADQLLDDGASFHYFFKFGVWRRVQVWPRDAKPSEYGEPYAIRIRRLMKAGDSSESNGVGRFLSAGPAPLQTPMSARPQNFAY